MSFIDSQLFSRAKKYYQYFSSRTGIISALYVFVSLFVEQK